MGCCGSTSNNSCDVRCCCCCPRVPFKISCCSCCFFPSQYSKLRCDVCIRTPESRNEETQIIVVREEKYIQHSPDCTNRRSQTEPLRRKKGKSQDSQTIEMSDPERKTPELDEKSSILVRDSSPLHHFAKFGVSFQDPSVWIEDFKDEALTNLEAALQGFEDQIDQLSKQIAEAKENCNQSGDYDMNIDESAAIYIHSMRAYQTNVGDLLEEAWKRKDRSAMLPWFKYIKLLHCAIHKLPNITGECWQGVACNDKYEEQLKQEPLKFFTCMNVCTPSSALIKNYLKKQKHENILLIGYQGLDAKDITEYVDGDQSEIFLWPGQKLNTIERDNPNEGLTIMHFSCRLFFNQIEIESRSFAFFFSRQR